MVRLTPENLSKDVLLVHLAEKYNWDTQQRECFTDTGCPVATDRTGTETITGNLLDTDTDNDDSY